MLKNRDPLKSVDSLGAKDNTTLKFLTRENADIVDGSKILPRTVKKAHYTVVLPEPVPNPKLLAFSPSCALSVGLDPDEKDNPLCASIFSGNKLAPQLDQPYCSVYGCHSHGQWFGQLGDGRAISIGESHTVKLDDLGRETLEIYELQLKGCGRSPFSRGFDGRAVLRSTVREFLVSEAMYHLRVPTTRALTIVTTGQRVRRAWYAANSRHNPYKEVIEMEINNNPIQRGQFKFPPDSIVSEPGAVLCRVAPSFYRFAHLELFAKREEWQELMALMNLVCLREYPHLLSITNDDPPYMQLGSQPTVTSIPSSLDPMCARRVVELFRCIVTNAAHLVAEWLRVGYTQGNMNSDNTLLSGRTVDYGPYGWMEKFDPKYQPFTTDAAGNFAFEKQVQAMGINVQVLGESTFVPLLRYLFGENKYDPICEQWVEEVRVLAEEGFTKAFEDKHFDNIRCKLGLKSFIISDYTLYSDLLDLMHVSGADYTILFRELGNVDWLQISDFAAALSNHLMVSFYGNKVQTEQQLWITWLQRYKDRLQVSICCNRVSNYPVVQVM